MSNHTQTKFDEIDYNLPSIKKAIGYMKSSKYLKQYDVDFVHNNFISCEKEICKRLDWNFNQSTVFHFYSNLKNQGIVLKTDQVPLNTAQIDHKDYAESSQRANFEQKTMRASSACRYDNYVRSSQERYKKGYANRSTIPLRNSSNSRNS